MDMQDLQNVREIDGFIVGEAQCYYHKAEHLMTYACLPEAEWQDVRDIMYRAGYLMSQKSLDAEEGMGWIFAVCHIALYVPAEFIATAIADFNKAAAEYRGADREGILLPRR